MATSEGWELRLQESGRRFYRNLNDIGLNWGMPPIIHPSIQAENEENSQSIFVKILFEDYLISCEVLDKVFSGIGELESIEKFHPPIGFHSKICFRHKKSAVEAFNWLNGRNIYDKCCQLELFLVEESNVEPSSSDSTSEIEVQDIDLCGKRSVGIQELGNSSDGEGTSSWDWDAWKKRDQERSMRIRERLRENEELLKEMQKTFYGDEFQDTPEESNVGITSPTQESEIEVTPFEEQIQKLDLSSQFVEKFAEPEILFNSSMYPSSSCNSDEGSNSKVLEIPKHSVVDQLQSLREEIIIPSTERVEWSKIEAPMKDDQDESHNFQETIEASSQGSKVILKPCEIMKGDCEIKLLAELVNLLIEWIDIRVANSRTDLVHCMIIPDARKVFVEMCERGIQLVTDLADDDCEPRGAGFGGELNQSSITLPYDRGRASTRRGLIATIVRQVLLMRNMIFDPGIANWCIKVGDGICLLNTDALSLVFDSGGMMFMFDPRVNNWGLFSFVFIKHCLNWRLFDRGRPFDRGKGIYISVSLHVQLRFGIKIGVSVRLIYDPGGSVKVHRDGTKAWYYSKCAIMEAIAHCGYVMELLQLRFA